MNRVIAWLKNIRLGQILTAFLAGVLLVVSTACSNNAGVQAKNGNRRPEVPDSAVTTPYEGPMNDYSDLDPRAGKAKATAAEKAAALKENSERNLSDHTSNVGENVKRTVDKKAEDLAKGTKQAVENVKDNTLDATRDVTSGVNRAADNVKQSIKANTSDAEDLSRGAKQAAENTTENTKAAGINLVDKAQQAIENTGGFVQEKLNQAAGGTQRSVDKAGNAINDAID